MKKETSKKIMETIKKEKIKPKEKWFFILKKIGFWLVLTVVVLLGAVFLSLAILSFSDYDLELFRALQVGHYVRLLVFTAPYLWMLLLVGSILLSYFVFRKTKTGYRYSILLVAMVILLIVSALGVGAHVSKMNDRMERAISEGVPPLGRLAPPREQKFFRPEEGIISGRVIEKDDNKFKLQSPREDVWNVSYDNETIYKQEDLEVGGHVIVVVGEEIGEKEFMAKKIKRLRGPGRMQKKGKGTMQIHNEKNKQFMPGRVK